MRKPAGTWIFISCSVAALGMTTACGKAPPKEPQAAATVQPTHTPYPIPQVNPSVVTSFADVMNHYADGRPTAAPWAGSYYPYVNNGIATVPAGATLSAAQKYDLARGCHGQAQAWEIWNHGAGVRGVSGWWGHCNGWSAAASLYPEPPQSLQVNGIEFTRGDIKALLTEAGTLATFTDWFGHKVNPDDPGDISSPAFQDVSPDEYLLVLANHMGKAGEPVVIDQYTGNEVWNQPLAAYHFDYPKKKDYLGADPGHPTIYKILVRSTLWWANDQGLDPEQSTPEFAFRHDLPYYELRHLEMEVWLDGPVVFDDKDRIVSAGDVISTNDGGYEIGGDWRDATDWQGRLMDIRQSHPDFIWIPDGIQDPSDPAQNSNADTNPYLELAWLKRHLVNHEGDEPPGQSCPAIADGTDYSRDPRPSPSPSASPSPST